MSEKDQFLGFWGAEALATLKLIEALPADQYDFRPDPNGRSLGELAWHLAEGDAYMTYGIEAGEFRTDVKPPNIERPRTIEGLATGYKKVHEEAAARIKKLKPEQFDSQVKFFDGSPYRVGDLLWKMVVMHLVHHRGQLSLMCRLAGGAAPGLYGPNREEMAAMRAAAEKASA